MAHGDLPPPEAWDGLLAAVRSGDQHAAEALVQHLYGHVIRIIRSHLPRATDEQDLAQDVFLKVFTKLDSFRGDQPFPHWVARIAVNTCYDRLRHQRSRPEIRFADLSEEESEFLAASLSSPETETAPDHAPAEAHALIGKLLDTLNPTEQTVLRLLDLEQKSVREISEITGWGASKVKVTAMRARRKLNETLHRLESGLR
jgi:RNA polymerase sigma-70 factor (ECF subfamily)